MHVTDFGIQRRMKKTCLSIPIFIRGKVIHEGKTTSRNSFTANAQSTQFKTGLGLVLQRKRGQIKMLLGENNLSITSLSITTWSLTTWVNNNVGQ